METAGSGASDKRIIVVDDNRANRDLLARALGKWGYTNVVCLEDPREFMTTFRESKPDLVFLDCHMPFMSGIDLLRQIREEPVHHDTHVVMLTGDSGSDIADDAISLGITALVTKPYTLSELRKMIEKLLGPSGNAKDSSGEHGTPVSG